MALPANVDIVARFKAFSSGAGVFSVVLGCIVLLGWTFNLPVLKGIFPSWIAMATNTAIAFILLGLALYFIQEGRNLRQVRAAQTCAMVIGMLGLFNLADYLFGLDVGIHELLFKEPDDAIGSLAPNRMAFTTALNFVLLSLSVLMFSLKNAVFY